MLRVLLSCTALVACAAAAQADTLRIVVPFSPGGAQDTLARWYAAQLDQRTDYTVIVENHAGAGGSLAANIVAQSEADPLTLLLATGGAITIAPHLRELTYDPEADFAPVARVADTPMTLAVRADSAFETLDDVLEEARADPGGLAFASTGHTSVSHLTGTLLAQAADVELLHVPYQGAAQALTDLLAGEVQLIVTSAASIDQYVASGDARVLVVFSPVELSNLEGIPTIEEAIEAENLNSPVWAGFLAPVNTPDELIASLGAEIEAICESDETAERYVSLGAVADCGDAAALEQTIREDHERWGRVISEAGITVE